MHVRQHKRATDRQPGFRHPCATHAEVSDDCSDVPVFRCLGKSRQLADWRIHGAETPTIQVKSLLDLLFAVNEASILASSAARAIGYMSV